MIIVLIGKSAAGKSYLLEQYASQGYSPIVSFTTRPMRAGEVDGVDYHFIDPDTFTELICSGSLVEYSSFDTLVSGVPATWYYGTPVVDSAEDHVIAADYDRAMKLVSLYGSKSVDVVYVDAPFVVRTARAMSRGSFDRTEWNRRAAADDIMYSADRLLKLEAALGHPLTVINNEGVSACA